MRLSNVYNFRSYATTNTGKGIRDEMGTDEANAAADVTPEEAKAELADFLNTVHKGQHLKDYDHFMKLTKD